MSFDLEIWASPLEWLCELRTSPTDINFGIDPRMQ